MEAIVSRAHDYKANYTDMITVRVLHTLEHMRLELANERALLLR